MRKDRAWVSFRMQQEGFPKGLGRKKLDWIREWGLKEVTEPRRATEIRSLATRNLLGTRPFLHNTSHLFLQGRDVNQPCLTEGKAEAQTKSSNHCSELQRAGFLYKALTSLCRGNKKEAGLLSKGLSILKLPFTISHNERPV